MRRFCMIVFHYIKRMFRDIKEIALLLAIPLGLIIFNSVIGGDLEGAAGVYLEGHNLLASFLAPAFLLSFQFFNSFFIFAFLYKDFRGEMRSRLLATPCTVRTFVLPAFVASWLLSFALGVVLIVITALTFNVYWGNLFVLGAVLVIISLMATFAGVLIFLLTKRLTQANAIGYIVAFGLMILSGMMIPLQLFGDNAIIRFLTVHGTPLSLGQAAIVSSGSLDGIFAQTDISFIMPGVDTALGAQGIEQSFINIGILTAITLVLGLVTVILAGRRKI